MRSFTARGRVGMCPRQGSNFLLLAQEKVTKEKGTLLAGRPRADCSALLGLCGSGRNRYAACGRCARTAARSQFTRRAARAPAKPCAARRLTKGPKRKVARCAGILSRLASHRRGFRSQQMCGGPLWHGVDRPNPCSHTAVTNGEPLCFGYFHLARQMKVTRLPGRLPGADEQARKKHREAAPVDPGVRRDDKTQQIDAASKLIGRRECP